MLKNRFFITALIFSACIGSVLLFRALKVGAVLPSAEQRTRGDKKAPIQITEYFDYQCPPCANARKLLEDRMKERPGEIHLEVRYFPLSGHMNSLKAAVHAECAARQGAFWKFHDEVFSHQSEWATDPYAELKFLTYVQSIGIDLKKWDTCTKDPAVAEFVQGEKKQGETLGLTTTPSFFVNGKLVVGVFPFIEEVKQLESRIEQRS